MCCARRFVGELVGALVVRIVIRNYETTTTTTATISYAYIHISLVLLCSVSLCNVSCLSWPGRALVPGLLLARCVCVPSQRGQIQQQQQQPHIKRYARCFTRPSSSSSTWAASLSSARVDQGGGGGEEPERRGQPPTYIIQRDKTTHSLSW